MEDHLITRSLLTSLVSFSLLISTFVLQSCGGNNTGSDVTRDLDRDRERANVVAQSYKGINGTYSGASNNSDIFLIVTSTVVTKDSSFVPVPTLVGRLVFSPRIVVGLSRERLKVNFPFNDGAFDPSNKGQFSFTLEKDNHPSTVSCRLSDSTVKCTWNKGLDDSQFVLKRDADDALDKLDSRSSKLFGGSYVGRVPNGLLVKATFNPGLTNRPDSMVPQVSMVGTFTFYPKDQKAPAETAPVEAPMSFTDGSYDVSSGTIVMTVTAQDTSNIVVNCKIETTDSLDCRWLSREPTEFRLTKSLTKY